MALKAYQQGYKHGKEGKPFLCHRKNKLYDSRTMMRSYEAGFADGAQARFKEREVAKETKKGE